MVKESEGEGLEWTNKNKVRWGSDSEGTQEEYEAFLESERKRIDEDPELVAFWKGVRGEGAGGGEEVVERVGRVGGQGGGGAKRERRPRSMNLGDDTWEALQSMAAEAGFVRGSSSNVSAFIEAWVWNKL